MTTTANKHGAGVGLNPQKWSRWKRSLLMTATYDPNDWDLMNTQQKWWTKEVLVTLKKMGREK